MTMRRADEKMQQNTGVDRDPPETEREHSQSVTPRRGAGTTRRERPEQEADPACCPNAELAGRQQRFLAALVLEPDIQAAAKAAGVGRTTAHRWLREPAFRDELARQRGAVLAAALGIMKAHTSRAVAELAKLLDTGNERLRRQVCNDILVHALKIRNQEDIERRLAILEKKMGKGEKKGLGGVPS
jgi:hypothetical protein